MKFYSIYEVGIGIKKSKERLILVLNFNTSNTMSPLMKTKNQFYSILIGPKFKYFHILSDILLNSNLKI